MISAFIILLLINSCVVNELLMLFYVLQEAIMITLAAAASHSVIPKTFSGNSLAAEIHLQIFLVSLFLSFLFLKSRKKQGLNRVIRVQSRQRLLLVA